MPKAATGVYAVAKGFNPGLYPTWDDCELQIKGFPGAKHKKFRNQEQATEWLASHGVSESWRIQPVASSSAAPAAPARTATQGRSAPGGSKGKARVAKPEDSKDVIQDTTGWEIVYCDGACRGNGKAGAIAGVGVWWGADDPRNIAERCPGDQTNNRAELIALVRILETVPPSKTPLLIRTDSKYSIQCFKDWLPKWKRNGFRTSAGKDVSNIGIIRYFDALLQERMKAGQKVHLEYVRGHMGEQGNEGADSQANLGCEYPEKPDPDWVALEAGVRKRLALAPGEGYKISQAAPAAAVAEPAPPIRPTTAAAEVSLEEMEDLAQFMTDDIAADLSD